MHSWTTYIHERFFPIIWIPIAVGISISGNYLNQMPFYFMALLLVFIGVWSFLFLLRVMSDVKDLEKNRVAYPDYPLSRGLLKVKEARQVILRMQIGLILFSAILWIFLQKTVALCFLVLVAYAWLYYKDFFIKSILDRKPFVRIFLYQLFALPLAVFSLAASKPNYISLDNCWPFAVLLFAAFTLYDICLKINPHLHPILATPIHFYGYRKTFEVAVFVILLEAFAAYVIGKAGLLWYIDMLVLISLIAVFYEQKAYRAAELSATVSLLVHSWVGIL